MRRYFLVAIDVPSADDDAAAGALVSAFHLIGLGATAVDAADLIDAAADPVPHDRLVGVARSLVDELEEAT